MSMLMGEYALTSFRTGGPQHMMCLQFSHPSSHFWTSPIPIPQPTVLQLNCIRKIGGNMKSGWLQLWNRAGWSFLKRVKVRRWRVNLRQTETMSSCRELIQCQHSPFILGDADEWTLQTRNYYNVNS